MAVTVKQIADELGISFQLVSAVLNNKNYCRASKAKKQLIFDTAARLGYRPNVNARILTGKPSKILGVLADLQAASPASKILAMLEREAAEYGFRLMIGGFHDRFEDIVSSYRLLLQHGVDGVFLIALDDLRYRQEAEDFFRNEKNLVVVRAPLLEGHFCIEVDLAAAFSRIVHILQTSGRKNIHYLGQDSNTYQSLHDRATGFAVNFPDAARRIHYLDDSGKIADGMEADEFVEKVVKPEKIDALVIQDDLTALYWLNILAQHGLRIPDDVAVTGCNNENFTPVTVPGLATIDFREAEITHLAMELMQRSLKNMEPETVKIIPEFIRRKSCQ